MEETALQVAKTQIPRTEGELIPGTVKTWNVEKGYGFLSCDDNGEDLFIHQSAIQVAEAKFRALAPSAVVVATFSLRDGKPTCASVSGPDGAPLAGFESKLAAIQQIARSTAAPGSLFGKCKWFNTDKGFGFIVPDDGSTDVFVNIKDIEGNQPLRQDDPVQYVLAKQADNRDRATKVKCTRPAAPVPFFGGAYNPYGGAMGGMPVPPAHNVAPSFSPYGIQQAPAPVVTTAGMRAGTIKWFNGERGFGFIIPANGGTEVYFRGNAVQGGAVLTEGDPIEFSEKFADGKAWADEVISLKNRKRKAPAFDGFEQFKTPRQGPYGQIPGERPQGQPGAGGYDPYGNMGPQGGPPANGAYGNPSFENYGAPQGQPYPGQGPPQGGPAGRPAQGGYETPGAQPSYYGHSGPPTYY